MVPTTVVNETEVAVAADMMTQSSNYKDQSEVEFARCECCGLTEECTAAYVSHVKERFGGRWICGLCTEAVKDEITCRSKKRENHLMISTDEALNRHMKFCEQFRSSSPPARPAGDDLISAMKHILRRSLDSPPKSKSPPPTSFLASKAF
ncbi:hypothetical protein CICLE_v10009800mg [Citrus x clementina]|uniref:DUF1677 family protein (DUF1677) n=3 Tax=Citrus TaxID=2706 RepID=A0ACB8P3M2_CITSI|nr:hypothetical protein CICLE_v10009800mg [Citrus x clementina]KAH9804989.1 DUF1677 family protein (DUF1677) [Citrus sinensis]KDO73666.1 hypothetical protein CISIN_1g042074mg [Citrus sinensis]